jgi:hypothetical protein
LRPDLVMWPEIPTRLAGCGPGRYGAPAAAIQALDTGGASTGGTGVPARRVRATPNPV